MQVLGKQKLNMGEWPNNVRPSAETDPMHPDSQQGEVGTPYTLCRTPDPHFSTLPPYPYYFFLHPRCISIFQNTPRQGTQKVSYKNFAIFYT
jgi:hypothetical protein